LLLGADGGAGPDADALAERDGAGDDGAGHHERRLRQVRHAVGQRDDRGAVVDCHGASVRGERRMRRQAWALGEARMRFTEKRGTPGEAVLARPPTGGGPLTTTTASPGTPRAA